MKSEIFFLGTGAAIPTAKRNHTAVLLKYKDENILIDCGEGTQRQFRKAKLNPQKLTRLLITHWHGDHILGIPGLLQTLALNEYNKTLYIYGPKGTKHYIEKILGMFVFVGKIKVEVEEVNGKFLETKDFILESFPLLHGPPVNGYCFIEKEKLRLDKSKLKKLKLPSSPELSKLQEGKSIKHNGKIIKSEDVTYKQPGKKVSFVFDTGFKESILKHIKDSDLLISESTHTEEGNGKMLAKEHMHLTAKNAATLAKKSKSKQLILMHISQRYDQNEEAVLTEAKKTFKNTSIAKDLDILEI